MTDKKVELKKGVVGLIGHEFLFLYLHLLDLYLHQILGENRDLFQDYVVREVLDSFKIDLDDSFINIYNSRLREYSLYKILIADRNKEESPKGTLFWEFGKHMSSLISGFPDHISLVMAVQNLVVCAWTDLWSLQLPYSK